MAHVTDLSTMQFRMLNKSKGPAMWSPRAQCDRMLFSATWRNVLEQTQNLDMWQDKVTALLFEDDVVVELKRISGKVYMLKRLFLQAGLF